MYKNAKRYHVGRFVGGTDYREEELKWAVPKTTVWGPIYELVSSAGPKYRI